MNLIVAQHSTTAEYLKRFPLFEDFRVVDRLGPLLQDVRPGDVVCGALPHYVASSTIQRGGRYWHIWIDHRRLRTLTNPTPMDFGRCATVAEYVIERKSKIVTPEMSPPPA